jgi:hypothetical protein
MSEAKAMKKRGREEERERLKALRVCSIVGR